MIIRQQPEDFQVDEQLRAGCIVETGGRANPHVLYRVTKTSLTTPEAAARLAKALHVNLGAVSYAGMKDKHALTTQHMSVKYSTLQPATPVAEVQLPGMQARHVGFTNAPLRSLDILGNGFTIVVRGCTRQDIDRMTQRGATMLDRNQGIWFVNYFGEQRFGSARHGGGFAATRLIKGDFEGALKLLIGTPARKDSGSRRGLTRAAATHWGHWKEAVDAAPLCPLRRSLEVLAAGGSFKDAFVALPYVEQELSVDSFQSWLWNQIVAAVVRARWGTDLHESSNFKEDGMVFPTSTSRDAVATTGQMGADGVPGRNGLMQIDEAEDHESPKDGEDAVALELPRPGMHVPSWVTAAVAQVFAEHGLGAAELVVPGVRRPVFSAGRRGLLAYAQRVEMQVMAENDAAAASRARGPRPPTRYAATLTFTLASGAYATVLLRALGQ